MSEVLEILQRQYRKHYFVFYCIFYVVPKNMKMFDIVSSNNNTVKFLRKIFHEKNYAQSDPQYTNLIEKCQIHADRE